MTPDEIWHFKEMVRLELSVAANKEAFLDRKDQVTVRDAMSLLDTIDRLKMQNERLLKAVEYYSLMTAVCRHDDSSWCDHCPDGGKRARQSLKDCEEM